MSLNHSSIVSLVGQTNAAGVAQHVGGGRTQRNRRQLSPGRGFVLRVAGFAPGQLTENASRANCESCRRAAAEAAHLRKPPPRL